MATASRTIREKLIETINTQNNLSLEFEQVAFDPPTILDDTVMDLTDPTKRNTTVHFYTVGNGTKVDATVKYNRLSLVKMFQLYSKNIPDNPEATTLYELLPAISLRLGVTLDSEDFVDNLIVDGESTRTVTMTARAGSFVYFGEVILTLGAGEVALLEHNADALGAYFAGPVAGDWTLWMGAQSHYLKLTFPDGPEIVIKPYQFRGNWEDHTPVPTTDATRDVYALPALPEYHDGILGGAQIGTTLAIGQTAGSVFDDYEFSIQHNPQYLGAASVPVTYDLIERTAENIMRSANLFSDLNNDSSLGASPPPAWDVDLQQYRYVVTEARTRIGFIADVGAGGGVPTNSYAALQVTVNALPADTCELTVNFGEQTDIIGVRTLNTWTFVCPIIQPAKPDDANSTVLISFDSLTSLQGLDVTIQPVPAQLNHVALRDTVTNLLYDTTPLMVVNTGASDNSLVGVDIQGERDLSPSIVPMSGSGYPYGTYDTTLTVRKISTNETFNLSVRGLHPDGREEPNAEMLYHSIQTDNACPVPFLNALGDWPVPSEGGMPIPLDNFVVARSADVQTEAVLRPTMDYSTIGWTFFGQNTDVQNGPLFDAYMINSEFWNIDFGYRSDDGDPIISSAANNTVELEMIPYFYNYDPDTNVTISTPGTPRTFVIQEVAGAARMVCAALAYDQPIGRWDAAGNVISGRLNSKHIGQGIDDDIQQGQNASGSPYGYFRWVLKRKKAGVIDSKFTCACNIRVGTEV